MRNCYSVDVRSISELRSTFELNGGLELAQSTNLVTQNNEDFQLDTLSYEYYFDMDSTKLYLVISQEFLHKSLNVTDAKETWIEVKSFNY